MTEFNTLVDQLRRIVRGQETYGQGTPVDQAKQFHLDHLLGPTGEIARENSRAVNGTDLPHVELLVSLAGFSPGTTVVTYEVLRPQHVLIVSGVETEQFVDVIGEHLVRAGRLTSSQFRQATCDPTNPLEIYQIVRKAIEDLESDRRESTSTREAGSRWLPAMIDITGGKKVMSATAALAAGQLDLPLCYLDGDFDRELKQPQPGTERLLLLDAPSKLFGEEQRRKKPH